jgi:hypothetical protein
MVAVVEGDVVERFPVLAPPQAMKRTVAAAITAVNSSRALRLIVSLQLRGHFCAAIGKILLD